MWFTKLTKEGIEAPPIIVDHLCKDVKLTDLISITDSSLPSKIHKEELCSN